MLYLGSSALRLRSLLEAITGIAVFAARPPVTAPLLERRFRRTLSGLRRLRRLPQPPARKPFHDNVGVLSAQLIERRQELFALARAKGRRLLVDEDGPVRVARRHPCIVTGIGDLGFGIRPADRTAWSLERSEFTPIRNDLPGEDIHIERDDLEAGFPDFDMVPPGSQRQRRLIRRELLHRPYIEPIDIDTGFRRRNLKAQTSGSTHGGCRSHRIGRCRIGRCVGVRIRRVRVEVGWVPHRITDP